MGAWEAVQRFVTILSQPAIVPTNHVGVGLPTKDSDLPGLVVAISEVKEAPLGLGGLAGLGKFKNEKKEITQQWIETRGSGFSGLMTIEVWGSTTDQIVELTNVVFQHLETSEAPIRGAGFLKFTTREVRPIEQVKLGTGDSAALRMAIGFSIVYEEVREIKSSTKDPIDNIEKINVEVDIGDEANIRDHFAESMSIHK